MMRNATALAICGLLAGAGAAHGDAGHKPVDISKEKGHMVVLTDGAGHYVVATPSQKAEERWLFYGDGKTFYQQRTFGWSADGTRGTFSWRYWSPRVYHRSDVLKDAKGKWWAKCDKRKTELKELPPAESKKMIAAARFLSPYWKHQAYALARDDRGTYYYVDRLRDDYGGKGFRVFVGLKGNMKQRKLTNIVSDSEGDIFSTKRGQLRFILDKNNATWVRGKARTDLTYVPVERNVKMIYADLGVYLGDLGTPCDHM